LNYEDKFKNMSNKELHEKCMTLSNKELHEECMTFFFEITNRKDKPVLLNAEEKTQANSIAIESIKRMENCTDSIDLLRSCAFALQNLIKESLDKESDIPPWIREWEPR
jgi:hypothetical protein